jgi:3-oxoadipate CoA-transferase, alpha subunit
MIDKRYHDVAEAVSDVRDGACVLIGGFGEAGNPTELVHALIDQGARELTVVNNNSGAGDVGLSRLIGLRRVRRLVCSFPRNSYERGFAEEYRAGRIELELVPQGTLVERIRAGGAGIPAFYTPTGAGTMLAEGKETRVFNGRVHVLEHAIRGDFAFIKAEAADRWGNLVYRMAARNFGPIMATAATVTVAQVRRTVELGALDPEAIVTPSIFVHRVVTVPHPIIEREYLAQHERQSVS